MTNFQPLEAAPKRLITPERAVFVLPIAAGAALALLLGLTVLSPLLYQLQQRRAVVSEMERKRTDLPMQRQQLNALLERQQSVLAQQERLLRLIAGKEVLRTWMAQLNRIAVRQGVSILLVEPQPTQVYTPPQPPPDGAPPASPAAPVDPLLAPNLEKRSAVITVQGPFPALVRFLQQMELLEVIVVATDMELELVPPQPDSKTVLTKLKLTLSAYGRNPRASS